MNQDYKHILIVGGNGFIGSHLVDALLLRGNSHVCVLDAQSERFRAPLSVVEYFLGSYTDNDLLSTALKDCDTLVHLAHNGTPSSEPRFSGLDMAGGEDSFAKLLEMAVQQHVKQVLLFSSGGAIYGDAQPCPIDELAECRPISSYGRDKQQMEKVLDQFHHEHGINYIIVRPSNPFGPRQDFRGSQGVIPIFMHRMLTGQPLCVWGDGTASKDYIYVSDLVSAVVSLMATGFDNEVYNIGSGRGFSLRSLITLLETTLGCKGQISYEPARATDVPNNYLSVRKLQARTGWQPRTSLEEGLLLTKCWYKESMTGAMAGAGKF